MHSPTTRVLALLELLQGTDGLGGAELARRLDVDGRTLRRYVAKLQALGIPVESDRGRYGAYRLKPGFKLPPLMFTDDEALAISIGLLFAAGPGSKLVGARSAQTKLERVMPQGLGSQLRMLHNTMQLDLSIPATSVAGRTLLELSTASHARQRVWMRYRAANGVITEREFDCFGLAWKSGHWYAVGQCQLRHGTRSFRVDRIDRVEHRQTPFPAPEDFDALHQLALGLAAIPRAHAVTVRLATDIAHARRALFDAIGLLVPAEQGTLLYGQADDLHWYARQLAGLPFDFEVVHPPALRDAIRQLAERLHKRAAARHPQELHATP